MAHDRLSQDAGTQLAGLGKAWARDVGVSREGGQVGRLGMGRDSLGPSSQICFAGADETKVCSRQVDSVVCVVCVARCGG